MSTFAADKFFEEGGDISSKISSPSEKPRPSVGTGGAERRDMGSADLLGTSEAAL